MYIFSEEKFNFTITIYPTGYRISGHTGYPVKLVSGATLPISYLDYQVHGGPDNHSGRRGHWSPSQSENRIECQAQPGNSVGFRGKN